MPISHASTSKAFTNAYAIKDMLWMEPITAALVCNKTTSYPGLLRLLLSEALG
jgi:hypothetical protein